MKKSILFGVLSVMTLSLCGCLNPHLSSMGASQMIVPHQPRLDVNGDTSAVTMSVDAYGGAKMSGRNIKDGFTAGATASLNYRPLGFSSPLYVEAALAARADKLRLTVPRAVNAMTFTKLGLIIPKGRKSTRSGTCRNALPLAQTLMLVL